MEVLGMGEGSRVIVTPSEAAEAWLAGEVAVAPSRDIVWRRIVEAAQTLKRLPDRERARLRANGATAWPDFLRKSIEAYGYSVVRITPSAHAIDRMEETMDWLRWPRPEDMRVAFLLASGVRAPRILVAVERFEGKRIRRQAVYERKATVLRRITARLADEGVVVVAAE